MPLLEYRQAALLALVAQAHLSRQVVAAHLSRRAVPPSLQVVGVLLSLGALQLEPLHLSG